MGKKLQTALWIAGGAVVLFLAAYLYSVFFKPNYGGANVMGLLLVGLLLGGVIAFLVLKLMEKKSSVAVTESSHTIVESMRKVFKIVCAEGQFHEIYNYEETRKILKFIPSTKKALVIVQAKVLIGYDFEKCVWETNEQEQKLKIVSFPEPEILSIEPEYKYYYFEDDIFNLISREDLHQIHQNGKKQVEQAALNSGLKRIAAEQMRTMLTEVIGANHWKLENPDKINTVQPQLQANNATN